MRKRITALIGVLLAVIFTVSVFTVPTAAASDDALSTFEGSGHRLDPFLINDADDLCAFRDLVNEGNEFSGKYFLQTADIDLSEIDSWTPIGVFNSGNLFYGVYNGGGHSISNLNVNAKGGNNGFFGQLCGTVMNLGIESGLIEGNCVGAFASHAKGGSAAIINCYNKATVKGNRAGGLADNFSGGFIVDSWNAGELIGDRVGGVVSYNANLILSSCTYGDAEPYTDVYFGLVDLVDSYDLSELDEEAMMDSFKSKVQLYATSQAQMMDNALEGEGTEKEPYLIKSKEDLCRFRSFVNLGCNFVDLWVRQEVDIDLEGEEWTPIGVYGKGRYFSGIYDGAGHTISNLRISSIKEKITEDEETVLVGENVGFFGILGGTVMNLGIESGRIEGSCVGSIASHGAGTFPVILNCYNKAEVVGLTRAGGIVDNFESGVIINCLNLGEVTSDFAGGISAYAVKRMIGSYSTELPVSNEKTKGIIETSCMQVENADEATELLNDGLYHASNKTGYQHNNLYKWESDVSFGAKHNYLLRFIIQEILIAIAVFGLALLAVLVWKCSRKEQRITLGGIGSVFSDGKTFLRGGISNRINALLVAGFVFGFGMLLVGWINQDTLITRAIFWLDSNDVFMDFLNPMQSVMNSDYSQTGHYTDIGGTYPPVARSIMWLMAHMLPIDVQLYGASRLRIGYGTTLVFFILVACVLILLFAYRKMGKEKLPLLALFAVLCSPMLYLVERGNILIVSLVFSALFILGYRSENNLIRHLSYVCLGIAAAIKIYPVVLGLLVVREKKWKHTVQCVAYGAAFCIIPFFIIGGIPEIMLYIRNVTTSFGKNEAMSNPWLLNYVNIWTEWGEIFADNAVIGRSIGKATLYIITALLGVSMLCSKQWWKAIAAGMLIIVLFPGFTSYYCAAFFAIPMMCFAVHQHKSKINYVYAVIFILLLAPLQFVCGALGVTQAAYWTFVGSIGVLFAYFLVGDCMVNLVRDINRKISEKRLAKAE